jgi:hypothetical protein
LNVFHLQCEKTEEQQAQNPFFSASIALERRESMFPSVSVGQMIPWLELDSVARLGTRWDQALPRRC